MRRTEIRPAERRLVGLLIRWRQATVSAVARAAGVDQGNLSRLIGASRTPGFGAAKLAAVLAELQWSTKGPAPGSVQRWSLDSADDVVWMFRDVLRGSAEVSVVMPDGATFDYLRHMDVLLCFSGTSVIVAVAKDSTLVDLMLTGPGLCRIRNPTIIQNAALFQRVLEGRFSSDEVGTFCTSESEAERVPESMRESVMELIELLGSVGRVASLIHDTRIMMARSFPDEYAAKMAGDWLDYRIRDIPPGFPLPRVAIDEARAWSKKKAEADGKKRYQLPWGREEAVD